MLSLNPQMNAMYKTFFNEAIEGGTLPEREKVIAILTAATLIKDQSILKNTFMTAKKLGLTKEEIGQITAIAIAVSSQGLENQFEIELERCCQ